MLTDRQNKFYITIVKLSLTTSTATDKERKYLLRAKKNIESGMKFGDSINALNLSLKIIADSGKSLTPDVKSLFEVLVDTYGEPDYRELGTSNLKGIYTGGFGF